MEQAGLPFLSGQVLLTVVARHRKLTRRPVNLHGTRGPALALEGTTRSTCGACGFPPCSATIKSYAQICAMGGPWHHARIPLSPRNPAQGRISLCSFLGHGSPWWPGNVEPFPPQRSIGWRKSTPRPGINVCLVRGARERLMRSLPVPLGVSTETRATDGGRTSEAPYTGLAAPLSEAIFPIRGQAAGSYCPRGSRGAYGEPSGLQPFGNRVWSFSLPHL